MDAGIPTVSAIVLAYKNEEWLPRCVDSLLASEKVDLDVVLVDNGQSGDIVSRLGMRSRVTPTGTGENIGFTGGCNLGVSLSTGEYVALVNGDAIVEPGTLARLVDVLKDESVGIAAAAVRIAETPELLNSSGNAVHVLGLSWVEGLGERETRVEPTEVAGAMGTCVVMRRGHWDALGGFYEPYFAYHEDAEISIRTWRLGLRVVNVPDAIVLHHYEFSRNPAKFYLAERNRLMFVFTLWGWRALCLLGPPLLALEVAMLAFAVKARWVGDKVRGWRWLWEHRHELVARRRQLQSEGRVPDRLWMRLLVSRVDTDLIKIPNVIRVPLNALTVGYWFIVRRLV